MSPKRAGASSVYEIPPNRILVTQDSPSAGWHLSHFYYVDGSGHRERLEYVASTIPRTPENLADERPIVWFQRGPATMAGVDLPCEVRYRRYYVGTRAHLLSRTREEANAGELELRQYVRENHLCP